MKASNIIITTNGVDVANPAILAKFAKGRVNGHARLSERVGRNHLAAVAGFAGVALTGTKNLKPTIRTGRHRPGHFSRRRGILLDRLQTGLADCAWPSWRSILFRLDWSAKLKWAALTLRCDRLAWEFSRSGFTIISPPEPPVPARVSIIGVRRCKPPSHNPLSGNRTGNFPAALRPTEIAGGGNGAADAQRLSRTIFGFRHGRRVGVCWHGLCLALAVIGRRVWQYGNPLSFAIFAGLLAWFVQGLGEFGFYVPALAWTAFTLLGSLTAIGNRIRQKRGKC